MTLLELAKQYKSDVEQRIKCIETTQEAGGVLCEIYNLTNKCINSFNDQLAHWKTTLKIIQIVIKENQK